LIPNQKVLRGKKHPALVGQFLYQSQVQVCQGGVGEELHVRGPLQTGTLHRFNVPGREGQALGAHPQKIPPICELMHLCAPIGLKHPDALPVQRDF
jgi:hypothetical protein